MASAQIGLRDAPFSSFQELKLFEESSVSSGSHGACSIFVGTMRDYNEGDSVLSMYLEHYPGMTEQQLEKIIRDAQKKYQLLEVFLLHRIGAVKPGEDIVLVAVWAAHRKDAFGACRAIMEQLKSTAPFWKKESLTHEDRWVTKNTPGE